MTRRTGMLAGLVTGLALVFIVITGFALWGPGKERLPLLSLLLRCDDGVAGTIAVSGGGIGAERVEDATRACAAGSIDFDAYDQGSDLGVRLNRDGAAPAELAVVYGRDIQTTPDGFFAVIAIRRQPPYLANDRL